ncbi:ribosome maturation factor RimP [Beggiatoa leptomitoformis]|nr:ribosome maturation factor RimP [Beggiatoa leptomitoformis]
MFDTKLQSLLEPTVTALGYELVGIDRLSQGLRGILLRVYIDSPTGITLDDCERVSRQVSGVLDVEDPIKSHYTLEISSPGLDRPLFMLEQFSRFIGRQVNIRLNKPLGTRRNFAGLLQGVQDQHILLVVEGTEYSLPYEQIDKARLVPEELDFAKH